MKKIILLILTLFGLGVFYYSSTLEENSKTIGDKVQLSSDHLIVFSQEKCPHCHEALAFIDGTIRSEYPDLKIEVLDIAQRENLEKLMSIATQKGYGNQIGTPLIVFREKHLMGWNKEYETSLKEIISSAFPNAASSIKNIKAEKQSISEGKDPILPEGICLPGDTDHCLDDSDEKDVSLNH